MKRNQRNQIQFNLKDYQFIITPESIKSNKPLEGVYSLQLEKGCKHLQSLPEKINFDHKDVYIFRQRKSINVRAYKQKNMNFSWSLYKIIDGMNEFVDTFNINLYDDYIRYTEEIRNLSFEYCRIVQQKDMGHQVGDSWNLMKMHLKNHEISQTLKSSSESITLECLITIRNEFDRLSYKDTLKNNKKSDRQVQEQNTSNKNQLKDKKKVRFIEQEKHSEKIQELKTESLIKSQSQKLFRPIQKQICPQDYQPSPSKSIPTYLPIQQSLLKSKTILSDIIEASNEGESHLNTGDKTDRKLPSELNIQTPNEAKNFSKTKTYHFQNDEQIQSAKIKRKNTHESYHRGHKMDEEYEQQSFKDSQLCKIKEPSECSNKDVMTRESTIIHPQSTQSTDTKMQAKVETISKKYIIIILILYFLLGALLCTQMKDRLTIVKSFSGKGKKNRRNEIDLKILFRAILK